MFTKNFLKASFLLSVPLSAHAMEHDSLQSLNSKSPLGHFLSQKQNREINRKLIKSRHKKKILLPLCMRQPTKQRNLKKILSHLFLNSLNNLKQSIKQLFL